MQLWLWWWHLLWYYYIIDVWFNSNDTIRFIWCRMTFKMFVKLFTVLNVSHQERSRNFLTDDPFIYHFSKGLYYPIYPCATSASSYISSFRFHQSSSQYVTPPCPYYPLPLSLPLLIHSHFPFLCIFSLFSL